MNGCNLAYLYNANIVLMLFVRGGHLSNYGR
jgi:hypothetical protein